MKQFFQDEEGQAVVEYVLGITTAVMIVAIVSLGIKRSLLNLWSVMTKQIATPCPTCRSSQNFKLGQ